MWVYLDQHALRVNLAVELFYYVANSVSITVSWTGIFFYSCYDTLLRLNYW